MIPGECGKARPLRRTSPSPIRIRPPVAMAVAHVARRGGPDASDDGYFQAAAFSLAKAANGRAGRPRTFGIASATGAQSPARTRR